MESLYRNSFVFKANRFEEYQDGVCLRNGKIETTIKAHEMAFSPYNPFDRMDYGELESKVGGADIEGGMTFILSGTVPSGINTKFNLPIMDEDVLSDRIQYGRLTPFGWKDPNEPVVCNIFNNMSCIRFAMNSPLRIIEFYGSFINE